MQAFHSHPLSLTLTDAGPGVWGAGNVTQAPCLGLHLRHLVTDFASGKAEVAIRL